MARSVAIGANPLLFKRFRNLRSFGQTAAPTSTMSPARAESLQDADPSQEVALRQRRSLGVLVCSPVAELTGFAYLNGLVQQEVGAMRPTHVPLSLRPSQFPREAFMHARDFLCPMMLRVLDAAARDDEWLTRVVSSAAADAEKRGEVRLSRMLGFLPLSRQRTMLGIVRADFMLDGPSGLLKQVETNTISAAFSCAAPRVQQVHRYFRESTDGPDSVDCIPYMRSDHGVVDALVSAHKVANVGDNAKILFVVLEEEHLLCESLMERDVRERHGVRTATLAIQGCVERLTLAASFEAGMPPILMLDGETPISVVYFRDYTDDGYTEEQWAARAMIERSVAIKCPSVGWFLAGSKVVQAALATPEALQRFLPNAPPAMRDEFLAALTKMHNVGTTAAQSLATANPSCYILKKERGVWVGDELVEKMSCFKTTNAPASDYFIMEKICPAPVQDVTFVREGSAVLTGPGLQELGMYGTFLGDGTTESFAQCVGYLVRTKPEDEVDGGVCKGIAVLDSLVLTD